MRLRLADRPLPQLAAAALLALAPKCVLCLLACAGIGTAWGLGGPEFCGAADASRSGVTALPVLWVALVAALALARQCRALHHPPVHSVGNISSSSTSKVSPDNGGTLPACMLP